MLVALFNQRRYAEMETLAREMTEHFPLYGFGWKSMGTALLQQGRNEEALVPLQKAAGLLQGDAQPHNNLGNALTKLDRLAEAEASYRRALEIEPNFAEAHNNLGNTLLRLNRLPEAEASYRRALKVKPNFAEAHNNLGNTLLKLGKLVEAEASYRRVLEIKPDFVEAHNNLGSILLKLDRLPEAEASYRRVLEIKPGFVEAHNNLGNTLLKLGKLVEAEASYRRVLEIKPDYAEVYSNLGNILHEQDRLPEAEASLRMALKLNPGFAKAHNNLGNTLIKLRRWSEAETSLRRAIEIEPDYAEAYINLCIALQWQGQLTEAEASYRRAMQIKPDYFEAQWLLSFIFLALGQFQRGWQEYEMRWKRNKPDRLPETPYSCWLGEKDIAGKKLLIQFEQGFGDAIQMLRYIPLLEQKNIECWIQVPNSLCCLVARSFPRSKVVGQHICPEGLDYRIPVMSLPLAMQTFSEQLIPSHIPYLIPDNDRVSFWQKQLASTRSKTVGLVWRGNPKHKNDRNRSASLMDLLPLVVAYESIQFVTLQKDLTDAERNTLKNYSNTRMLDAELTDFDETAAVMCNMDIVISVDSAPVHLSGALGKSTWILLPFSGEWRWMVNRADSPWYSTAKLFRQKSIGNWEEVITGIKASLAELDFIQHP